MWVCQCGVIGACGSGEAHLRDMDHRASVRSAWGQLLQQLALVGLLGLAHPELGVVLPDAPLHTPQQQSVSRRSWCLTLSLQNLDPQWRSGPIEHCWQSRNPG